MKQFLDFTDRVCLVTGAGSENGIGFQTARILGDLGGKVIIVSTTDRILKRAEELRAGGADAKGMIADLMDRQAVQHLVKDIMGEYGRIDVLVNNAGIMDNMAGVADALDEKFQQLMAVNVYGPMCAMRKAVQVFLAQGEGGCIINMGSEGARKNSAGVVYCASKAALESMSQNTAFMYMDRGIRVNTVAIGALETEISASIGRPDMNCMHRIKIAQANNPGVGQPIDAAYAVLYLASDEAKFINGVYLKVDGGWGSN